MTNVFKYFNFKPFLKDTSGAFSGNDISFSELNTTHFLIFESNNGNYNLHVAKYNSKAEIGVKAPLILELIIENYNKDIPEHRVAIRRYFE